MSLKKNQQNKKTDFLVTGSQKPTIKKVNDAKNLNIKILTENVKLICGISTDFDNSYFKPLKIGLQPGFNSHPG